MNQAVKEYRKATIRFFQCDSKHRKKLLRELDHCLAPLLEDVSEPDLQTLTAALGSPEDLAKDLMEEIPVPEVEQYKRRMKKHRLIGIFLAILLAVGLLAFSIYAIFLKETNHFESSEIIIIGDEREATEEEAAFFAEAVS